MGLLRVLLTSAMLVAPGFLVAADTGEIPTEIPKKAFISIIIDDIGHHRGRGEQAIDLPANLTFAVIPATTHATALARYAHLAGREVIIHMPMEDNRSSPLGEIALNSRQNEVEINQMFEAAVARVPFAEGINNHMGSSLTQRPQTMAWLMRSLKRHQFYFVDSRTTHRTVANEIAQHEKLRTTKRDVFLDNNRSAEAIAEQFQKLLRLAEKQQTAIAIGHPYPATIAYLSQALPALNARGIRVIPVSEMINMRHPNPVLAAVN